MLHLDLLWAGGGAGLTQKLPQSCNAPAHLSWHTLCCAAPPSSAQLSLCRSTKNGNWAQAWKKATCAVPNDQYIWNSTQTSFAKVQNWALHLQPVIIVVENHSLRLCFNEQIEINQLTQSPLYMFSHTHHLWYPFRNRPVIQLNYSESLFVGVVSWYFT